MLEGARGKTPSEVARWHDGLVSAALRLFVAIEPSELVRRRLAGLRADLERMADRAHGEVKWVATENVHLTLHFLGAVPEDRLDGVKEAIAAAAGSAAPLHLELKGAGGFPNARRPRVLWAGLSGDLVPLAKLVEELGRRLGPLGFPADERPFSPHLTLGRARDSRGVIGLGPALASAAEAPGAPWRATEVVLFRSYLSPRGPRYEPLVRMALGG